MIAIRSTGNENQSPTGLCVAAAMLAIPLPGISEAPVSSAKRQARAGHRTKQESQIRGLRAYFKALFCAAARFAVDCARNLAKTG
jgi:hypothetical protein